MQIGIPDSSEISEVKINDRNNSVRLIKTGNKWMVNNGYIANQNAIKRLFRVFINLEINNLVPENDHDSMIEILIKKGVSIEFYKNSSLKSAYWIGNYDQNMNATILMTDDRLPVYSTSPGLTNDIRKFTEPNPFFWRIKRIFDIETTEIKSISFLDNLFPENSFFIESENSHFKVYDIKHKLFSGENENTLRYMSYFKNIEFESLAEYLSEIQLDSVFKQPPRYTITVNGLKGLKIELNLLPILLQNSINQYDLNKIYGIINKEKSLLIIDYFAIDPLIKQINYFIEDKI